MSILLGMTQFKALKGHTMSPEQEYANSFINQEYKHVQEKRPDKWAALTQEKKDEFEQNWLNRAIHLRLSIENKSLEVLDRIDNGLFHPDNKVSRRLFERVTGIDLPATVGKTMAVVENWAGQALIDHRNAKLEAQKEKERAELEQEQKIKEERMGVLGKKVLANQNLNGPELVELAQYFNLKLHPRTVGMIRDKVTWVNSEQGQGRNVTTSSPIQVYRDIQTILLDSL